MLPSFLMCVTVQLLFNVCETLRPRRSFFRQVMVMYRIASAVCTSPCMYRQDTHADEYIYIHIQYISMIINSDGSIMLIVDP